MRTHGPQERHARALEATGGLTRTEIAREVDVDVTTLWRWLGPQWQHGTAEERARVAELGARDLTLGQIAYLTGRSRMTVQRWLRASRDAADAVG
jgi:DNA invertase Pin-like site-specific DNA recombinase